MHANLNQLLCFEMYTRQQASEIRRNFWTRFGQYMRPIPGAEGELINWLNYKTGVKHLYFRMDADRNEAGVSVEITHPDPDERKEFYKRLIAVNTIFNEITGEDWSWQETAADDHGREISRISKTLTGVNIFKTEDWPAIISFLKPRIQALDQFWYQVKDHF